jgi:hypothetical protein
LVANGRRLELPSADLVEDDHFALVNHGDLIAVYARRGDELVPERVVAPN